MIPPLQRSAHGMEENAKIFQGSGPLRLLYDPVFSTGPIMSVAVCVDDALGASVKIGQHGLEVVAFIHMLAPAYRDQGGVCFFVWCRLHDLLLRH